MYDYDVVICGLGAMGSAALWQLARRGVRVLGIERHAPGHDLGSSHGLTRVIRLDYFEHPSYVPLLRRSYALWRELEAAAGRPLLYVTGIAEIGPRDGHVVRGTLASSELHALPHELLTAADLMRRFPAFRVPPDYVGVLQPDGGFLEVEPALEAFVSLATAAGAEIRGGETVRGFAPRAGAVRVITDRDEIEAEVLVLAAGAWMPFAPGLFPVFMLESRHGTHYGIPPHGGAGVKIAKHHHRDEAADPDRYDRAVHAHDEALIRDALAEHIPAANGRMIDAKTCLYTNTSDGDFIIDRLPGAENVIVASPCSGHGFKFAPVIGEILADLALNGSTDHDISRFVLRRFA